jgi:hypothetical protein
MELYAKLGNGRYKMLSNITPLPSDRSVQARLSKGCNETDGVLTNNFKDMEELFTNAYGASVPETDFRRMVSLALHSTTINDGLVSNMHTGQIVGIGADDPSAGMDGMIQVPVWTVLRVPFAVWCAPSKVATASTTTTMTLVTIVSRLRSRLWKP